MLRLAKYIFHLADTDLPEHLDDMVNDIRTVMISGNPTDARNILNNVTDYVGNYRLKSVVDAAIETANIPLHYWTKEWSC
jgi:hypothetical protein